MRKAQVLLILLCKLQKMNLQKSSIFFGRNCEEQVNERVKQKLGVQDETLQSTCLGMPTWVGRSPTSNFNFLTGRLWKHLNGWSDRPLSRVGKEVLLKSVAQSIPTYVMSCFQIPLTICEKMRKPLSNFWWGSEAGKKKIHWRSWTGYHHRNILAEWVFGTWTSLTKLCWGNNVGVY
jgi:hypothetical protein